MTGNIINSGTTAFMPIVDKLSNITAEFIPYLIYIAIAILGIALTFKVVKYILNYTKTNTTMLFNRNENREYDVYKKSKFEKELKNDGIDTLFGEGEVIRTEKNAYKKGNRNYER